MHNVTLHNNFKFFINEKEVAKAENLVTNYAYARICDGSRVPSNIYYGSGAGTPSVTANSIFGNIGSKAGSRTVIDRTINESLDIITTEVRLTVELLPTELQNKDFTNIGIGTSATQLYTHALITDSEGNPITLRKGENDKLKIIATYFVTFSSKNPNFIMSPNTLRRRCDTIAGMDNINICGNMYMSSSDFRIPGLMDCSKGDYYHFGGNGTETQKDTLPYTTTTKTKINTDKSFSELRGFVMCTGYSYGAGSLNKDYEYTYGCVKLNNLEGIGDITISNVNCGNGDGSKTEFDTGYKLYSKDQIVVKKNGTIVPNEEYDLKNIDITYPIVLNDHRKSSYSDSTYYHYASYCNNRRLSSKAIVSFGNSECSDKKVFITKKDADNIWKHDDWTNTGQQVINIAKSTINEGITNFYKTSSHALTSNCDLVSFRFNGSNEYGVVKFSELGEPIDALLASDLNIGNTDKFIAKLSDNKYVASNGKIIKTLFENGTSEVILASSPYTLASVDFNNYKNNIYMSSNSCAIINSNDTGFVAFEDSSAKVKYVNGGDDFYIRVTYQDDGRILIFERISKSSNEVTGRVQSWLPIGLEKVSNILCGNGGDCTDYVFTKINASSYPTVDGRAWHWFNFKLDWTRGTARRVRFYEEDTTLSLFSSNFLIDINGGPVHFDPTSNGKIIAEGPDTQGIIFKTAPETGSAITVDLKPDYLNKDDNWIVDFSTSEKYGGA